MPECAEAQNRLRHVHHPWSSRTLGFSDGRWHRVTSGQGPYLSKTPLIADHGLRAKSYRNAAVSNFLVALCLLTTSFQSHRMRRPVDFKSHLGRNTVERTPVHAPLIVAIWLGAWCIPIQSHSCKEKRVRALHLILEHAWPALTSMFRIRGARLLSDVPGDDKATAILASTFRSHFCEYHGSIVLPYHRLQNEKPSSRCRRYACLSRKLAAPTTHLGQILAYRLRWSRSREKFLISGFLHMVSQMSEANLRSFARGGGTRIPGCALAWHGACYEEICESCFILLAMES